MYSTVSYGTFCGNFEGLLTFDLVMVSLAMGN